MRRLVVFAVIFSAGLAACRGAPTAVPAPAADAAWAAVRDRTVPAIYEWNPQLAIGLGLHGFDGAFGDRSPEALAAAPAHWHAVLAGLEAIDAAQLSPAARLEHGALRGSVKAILFDLEVTRGPWRNPFSYLRGLNLLDYVSRDYAPLADRARAVVKYAAGAKIFLAAARANLAKEPIPRPFTEVAINVAGGAADFARGDARTALAGDLEPALRRELDAALEAYAADVAAFKEYLITRRNDAPAPFALGPESYLRMLADLEDVVTDLPTLERVAAEDTGRNLAALDEAARKIDPKKTTAEVVAEVLSDHPSVAELLPVARAQVDETRAYVASHPIAAIPTDENALVELSPPFMRVNPAFLRSAGVFEQKPLPTFYFISPPDPAWPPEQQRTYVPARAALLFITVHEVWPGHFLQDLYVRKNPSGVVKSFCSYAFTEGWAHYAEEMMWDQGFGAGDPRLHIGQLQNALMRDVRFLASLGLHTRGMTVDEATALFQEKAFLGQASARQQAIRGTVDPGYLNYTLGKLMIVKLRDDWKAKVGAAYSPKAFHEALLGTGCQSLPLMREALVGKSAPL